MKFQKDAKKVFTYDPYYDLFRGGRVNPFALLEPEDAFRVETARKIITEFLEIAEQKGLIEYK